MLTDQEERRGLRRLADVLIAATATAASVWVMFAPAEMAARDPSAGAVGLLLTAGALLIFRRRWPVPVLLGVVAVSWVFVSLDFPGGAELPLIMVALYTSIAEGHRLVGGLVLALFAISGSAYRLAVEGDDPLLVIVTVSLLVLVAALGDGARTRRELRQEVQQRLRLIEAEKELEAQTRLTDERLRIARELHDVLAHTITAISVQAGATADGMDPDSDEAKAFTSMRATAREAMHQLRATIQLLRTDGNAEPPLSPPALADLDTLVRRVHDAGVEVEVDVRGPVRQLPAAVELTAYRIVQEALTNIIRHAQAARARVELAYHPERLNLTVTDDGPRPATTTDGRGHGIVGMRERAEALGGELTAGPADRGGFEVQATLPTGGRPA